MFGFTASRLLVLLAPLLKIAAALCWKARHEKDGLLPLTAYNSAEGIGGSFTSFVVLVRVNDRHGSFHGYALKYRGPENDGYVGYYHHPGSRLRCNPHDPHPLRSAKMRVAKEIYGDDPRIVGKAIDELALEVEPLPNTFVWAPFRKALETRLGMIVDLPLAVYEEIAEKNGFKLFPSLREIPQGYRLIPFEVEWMAWASNPRREPDKYFYGEW